MKFLLIMLLSLPVMTMAQELTSDQIATAQHHLSYFKKPMKTWDDVRVKTEGSYELIYKPEIDAILSQLSNSFYATPSQDWMTSQGDAYLRNPSTIANASLNDIRMLLGGIFRLERFNPGVTAQAIMDDVYLLSYFRLRDLSNTNSRK